MRTSLSYMHSSSNPLLALSIPV
ncbi:hypothetical protein LINPERHAP1_LOCUS23650 [Linum perenne]